MPPRPPLPYPRPPPFPVSAAAAEPAARSPNGIPEEAGASEKCVSSGVTSHVSIRRAAQTAAGLPPSAPTSTRTWAPPVRGGCDSRRADGGRRGTGRGCAHGGDGGADARANPASSTRDDDRRPGIKTSAGIYGEKFKFPTTSPSGRPGVGSSSGTRGRRRGRRGVAQATASAPRPRRPRRPPRTTCPRVPRWRTAEASGSRPSHRRRPPGRPRPRRSSGAARRAQAATRRDAVGLGARHELRVASPTPTAPTRKTSDPAGQRAGPRLSFRPKRRRRRALARVARRAAKARESRAITHASASR